jgi:hypothetical protein
MEKTGKPIAGGILNIVTGALGLLSFIGLMIALAVVTEGVFQLGLEFVPGIWVAPTVLIIVAIFSIIFGILALIGGIYAVQRKKWGLALAGSIIAILGILPLGIVSTILIATSKDEFE